jgi:hypothetical protein
MCRKVFQPAKMSLEALISHGKASQWFQGNRDFAAENLSEATALRLCPQGDSVP